MDCIKVQGGVPLNGTVRIAGAKNAALPLMAACLLSEKDITFNHVPFLADITTMAHLLVAMGVELTMESEADGERSLHLNAAKINSFEAPYEIVRKMRASVVVLGPLLARFGQAKVSMPGGCAIGSRPIDLHLKAFMDLGAEIDLQEGYVLAKAPKGGLKGGVINFPLVSVGATENAMMAAVYANGTTIINNAAREPEIGDLARCLNAMGAKITGIDSSTLEIEGVTSLNEAKHEVLADRIEAGTYAVAAAITGGDLFLKGAEAGTMESTLEKLESTGVNIERLQDGIRVRAGLNIKPVDIVTAPHPGFATDMQAQMTALLCVANGESRLVETIFENRFMHVPELRRMGADIKEDGNAIIIKGVKKLKGAPVMATDLRASVSLILAGLVAEGETVLSRVYHLDRGYEQIEEKLKGVGAKVERMKMVE